MKRLLLALACSLAGALALWEAGAYTTQGNVERTPQQIGDGHASRGRKMNTTEVIERFNGAFQRHDPAALSELIGEDCVLENTSPAPDGARVVGRAACLAIWESIARNTSTRFELEKVEVLGERAIIQWRYWWGAERAQSVRGVNLMRVRDGLIVEGLGYVKGT